MNSRFNEQLAIPLGRQSSFHLSAAARDEIPPDLTDMVERLLSSFERLDDRVRLILRRDGTLLAASSGASEFFQRTDCLTLQLGRVKATAQKCRQAFISILKTNAGATEALVLQNRARDGHCILHVTGLCTSVVALMALEANEGFVPKLADLATAFDLTPSEVHVVELLQQGHGPQHIGEDLGISVHTVRAHLRHCYDKLGVSSREELWQKLAPYRLN